MKHTKVLINRDDPFASSNLPPITTPQEDEIARLTGWLQKIEGGDTPCRDEAQLRQWAYEAITLRRML